MQESNQRKWHRGGADREAYRDCWYCSKMFLRLRAALPVAVPGIFLAVPAASFADRCHSLKSLLPPQAALLSLPLCTPSGTGRKTFSNRIYVVKPQKKNERRQSRYQKTTTTQLSMGAGWGSGGGRLKDGRKMLDSYCSNERLCGQRIPQPLSLVRFLCGHKK